MSFPLPLDKMSRAEKLRAMESLWADISGDDGATASPAWHAQALRQAEQAVQKGEAAFSDWHQAKQRVREIAAERR